MVQGPSGTVTFCLTDVVGSTQLWEQDRAAMADALQRHDDLVRAVVADTGGFGQGGRGRVDIRLHSITVSARELEPAAKIPSHTPAWVCGHRNRTRLRYKPAGSTGGHRGVRDHDHDHGGADEGCTSSDGTDLPCVRVGRFDSCLPGIPYSVPYSSQYGTSRVATTHHGNPL